MEMLQQIEKEESFDSQSSCPKKSTKAPEAWRRPQQKNARLSGKEYINVRGKYVPARKIGPNCNCKMMCFDNVSLVDSINNFQTLYSLPSYNLQSEFLSDLIEISGIKEQNRKPLRKYKSTYYVYSDNGKVAVCKKAFSSMFGISMSRIYELAKKIQKSNLKDSRGKHSANPYFKSIRPAIEKFVENKQKEGFTEKEMSAPNLFRLFSEKYKDVSIHYFERVVHLTRKKMKTKVENNLDESKHLKESEKENIADFTGESDDYPDKDNADVEVESTVLKKRKIKKEKNNHSENESSTVHCNNVESYFSALVKTEPLEIENNTNKKKKRVSAIEKGNSIDGVEQREQTNKKTYGHVDKGEALADMNCNINKRHHKKKRKRCSVRDEEKEPSKERDNVNENVQSCDGESFQIKKKKSNYDIEEEDVNLIISEIKSLNKKKKKRDKDEILNGGIEDEEQFLSPADEPTRYLEVKIEDDEALQDLGENRNKVHHKKKRKKYNEETKIDENEALGDISENSNNHHKKKRREYNEDTEVEPSIESDDTNKSVQQSFHDHSLKTKKKKPKLGEVREEAHESSKIELLKKQKKKKSRGYEREIDGDTLHGNTEAEEQFLSNEGETTRYLETKIDENKASGDLSENTSDNHQKKKQKRKEYKNRIEEEDTNLISERELHKKKEKKRDNEAKIKDQRLNWSVEDDEQCLSHVDEPTRYLEVIIDEGEALQDLGENRNKVHHKKKRKKYNEDKEEEPSMESDDANKSAQETKKKKPKHDEVRNEAHVSSEIELIRKRKKKKKSRDNEVDIHGDRLHGDTEAEEQFLSNERETTRHLETK